MRMLKLLVTDVTILIYGFFGLMDNGALVFDIVTNKNVQAFTKLDCIEGEILLATKSVLKCGRKIRKMLLIAEFHAYVNELSKLLYLLMHYRDVRCAMTQVNFDNFLIQLSPTIIPHVKHHDAWSDFVCDRILHAPSEFRLNCTSHFYEIFFQQALYIARTSGFQPKRRAHPTL